MSVRIRHPEYRKQLMDRQGSRSGQDEGRKAQMWKVFHTEASPRHLLDSGVPEEKIPSVNLESQRWRDLADGLSFYDFVCSQIPKEGGARLIFDKSQAA